MNRIDGSRAASSSTMRSEPSVEQSSMTMISFAIGTSITRRNSAPTVGRSLYTGTMTERVGAISGGMLPIRRLMYSA